MDVPGSRQVARAAHAIGVGRKTAGRDVVATSCERLDEHHQGMINHEATRPPDTDPDTSSMLP